MHIGEPSRTALAAARHRAAHQLMEHGRIFADPLAVRIIGEGAEAIARQAFDIPEIYILGSVIALGYQGEPAALPNQQFIDQEVAPRKRKPLKEFVFSAWDSPADIG